MNKTEENNLKTGQIEIKTYPNAKRKVAFNITAQRIMIDWGDGTFDKLIRNGVNQSFTHEYSNQGLQTINVNTEGMTEFDCSNDYWHIASGTFQELIFHNCTDLTSIYCFGNQLTALDVSGCTSLMEIDCRYNELSAFALNDLFNSLPTRTQGDNAIIDCVYYQQGCDTTIADKKGWKVN